ncbi:MAG TPA: alpha/beta fold hydrolase [Kofleriaceae bacterium]|nr:alpha/beta fold hydrolase [Kofleriaceae bacterium]
MKLLGAALSLALLAGCPQFHAGPLPGAPTDATFVDVGGVKVRYREAGQGPAVVLIHGFAASSDSWQTVQPVLAKHHRVIAIDLKGFGWTSRPGGDYSPAAQAQLAWSVLDQLGVTDVAIVGHSWGSSVALSMAVARPERVRRVALYDAYVYDDQVPSFFRWADRGAIGEALFALYYRQRIEERVPLAYFDDRWVTQARVEHVEHEMARPGTVAAALATVRGHHFAALHRKLTSFRRPVLLLWGEDDDVTPLRFAHRLLAELPNARLETYPRCGHLPMVEAHGPSTRDLLTFLAEDGRPDGSDRNANDAAGHDDARGDGGGDASDVESPRAGGGQGGGGGGGAGHGTGGGDGAASVADASEAPGSAAAPATDDVEAAIAAAAPTPLPAIYERPLPAGAELATLGAELTPRLYAASREHVKLAIHGGFRFREQALWNLDLDRGLDTRGEPLYPVPLGGGQELHAGDLRARTDVAVYAPGVGVAVKARIDWLDNVALGGDPELAGGTPATALGQRPTAVVVKRAWGEALTPFGVLAAGRMGAHFGLGITVNGGDCDDCDRGDAADRLAFISPLFGHLVAVAWDVAARGPFTRPHDGGHAVALEPADSASGVTLALLKTHVPAALERRAQAGLSSVEYGGYVATRSQDTDVPASYLPVAPPATFTSNDLMARGFSALTAGAWLRITRAGFRLEGELAYAHAKLAQPSVIAGAEITTPVTSDQLGLAVQSEVGSGRVRFGLDGGYASGDDAPGFGAFPRLGDAAPRPGSLDGAQANPPRDRTVDNFRFNPDYRIDQILFREIIGTVTDAIYVRPHLRTTLLTVGAGRLEASAALIASWAVEPTSTPSGARDLGIELDPELRYTSRDGFAGALTYGVLLPGAAFDNPDALTPTTLEAKAAHVLRARLWFVF